MEFSISTTIAVLGFLVGVPACAATLYVFFRTAHIKGRMDLLESENIRIRAEAGGAACKGALGQWGAGSCPLPFFVFVP